MQLFAQTVASILGISRLVPPGLSDATQPVAWRLRGDLAQRPVEWHDRLFGFQQFDPETLGDVILKRKDSLWAYQLAVVVDDAEQGITDIVRGFDLLDNTPGSASYKSH